MRRLSRWGYETAYPRGTRNPRLKPDFRHYKLDEMGMAFTDNDEIEFYIKHGIDGACFNVAHSILQY